MSEKKETPNTPTIEQLQQELEEKNKALASREKLIFEQKEAMEELEAKVKGSKARETVKIGKAVYVITCKSFIIFQLLFKFFFYPGNIFVFNNPI